MKLVNFLAAAIAVLAAQSAWIRPDEADVTWTRRMA